MTVRDMRVIAGAYISCSFAMSACALLVFILGEPAWFCLALASGGTLLAAMALFIYARSSAKGS